MQQSRTRTFIFVEGRDLDPNVYGAICGPVCTERAIGYEIVVADRINGAGGGKRILVSLHEFLAANNSLLDRTQAETKLAMFYLDKDVDDILKLLQVSDHIVYTAQYSIENHLFTEGDLVASLATAGSLDIQVIQTRIANPAAWRNASATRWREWVALCIVAEKLSLSHPVSYSRASSINTPAEAPANPPDLASCMTEMERLSGLQRQKFQRKLAAANRLVNAINGRGAHDLVFKGKWYRLFVERELQLASPLHNSNGALHRLIGSLIATTDFNGPWVQHFREPLRNALALL